MSNAAKNFDILATSLNVLRNYFDSLNYFYDLYLAKILDFLSTKPCSHLYEVKYIFYLILCLKWYFSWK